MYKGKFQVGDIIKAFDFQPIIGRGASYLEGRVVEVNTPDVPYDAYKVEVLRDVFGGENVQTRIGLTSYVPCEIYPGEYEGRISLVHIPHRNVYLEKLPGKIRAVVLMDGYPEETYGYATDVIEVDQDNVTGLANVLQDRYESHGIYIHLRQPDGTYRMREYLSLLEEIEVLALSLK